MSRQALCFALALSLGGCSSGLFRGYAEGRSATLAEIEARGHSPTGATRFAFDDMGSLNTDAFRTHAFPWKLFVAALLAHRTPEGEPLPSREEAVFPILREFGLFVPDSVPNTRGSPWPDQLASPLGILRGYAERDFPQVRIEVVNIGCAACHAGVTYDGAGNPRMEAWLGLPNTSLNLDGLTKTVLAAFQSALEHPGRLESALDTLYPAMDAAERSTLTRHVLPGLESELREREARWGGSTPYDPGGPGSANGLGAIAHVLAAEGRDVDPVGPGTAVQIPDLGDRMLKSSLAVDGTFGVAGRARFRAMTHADLTENERDGKAGILAFFAVPTMGLDPRRVPDVVPRAREIVDFLAAYRPPRFPGPVDVMLASRGEAVYAAQCAVCHGVRAPLARSGGPRLERLPNVLIPIDEIGTDPARWQAATPSLATAILGTPAGELLSAGPTTGYMAPPLTGLWATAPYLHNGSVPTLWHLMHPEARPARFEVGGHRLDYVRMGIDLVPSSDAHRYPSGYAPWSRPEIYDTARPGQANSGHEAPFRNLTEAEKSALTEYLKLL